MPGSATPANHYGAIAAEIYDLDKPVGSMTDTAFHLQRFAGFSGAILEPACGSGRALIPLLEAGLDATGFDPSPHMLERCRARCAARGLAPPLSAQRFEDFTYERRFAAIFVPAGSFTLIDDYQAALAVLERFAAHLEPGGLLVIDIDPLRSLGVSGVDRRRWTAANGDLLTLEAASVRTDWLAQRVEALSRYERWREGVLIETQLMVWAQRLWGLEEFRLTLAAAGFGAIEVTGGYDRTRPPRAGDRVLTFEARRP